MKCPMYGCHKITTIRQIIAFAFIIMFFPIVLSFAVEVEPLVCPPSSKPVENKIENGKFIDKMCMSKKENVAEGMFQRFDSKGRITTKGNFVGGREWGTWYEYNNTGGSVGNTKTFTPEELTPEAMQKRLKVELEDWKKLDDAYCLKSGGGGRVYSVVSLSHIELTRNCVHSGYESRQPLVKSKHIPKAFIKHGPFIMWDTSSAKKIYEGELCEEQLCGKAKVWDENGKLIYDGNYKEGYRQYMKKYRYVKDVEWQNESSFRIINYYSQ